jgi:hypothetical protein
MMFSTAKAAFLTDDQLRGMAPSVFADRPHDSRSERYSYIPTSRVVTALRGEGFQPVKVTTARVRDTGKLGFEKHMLRFRRSDAALAVGDVFPEIVLVNSHDGSTSYSIMAGLFRLACSNGMVVSAGSLAEEVKVRHSGNNIVDDVIEGSYRVLETSQSALEVAGDWARIELKPAEQMALATGAHHVRFADSDGEVSTPIRPDQFLTARRYDDRKNDLWTTFNRVQENTIKGGLRGVGRDAQGRTRRTSTKEVKGIDGNVNLNKALWKMAEMLAAAVGK